MAKYIVDSVARPTRPAEEAFYNMLRVQKTELMTYEEDDNLDYVLDEPGSAQSVTDNLDRWGWDGETTQHLHRALDLSSSH